MTPEVGAQPSSQRSGHPYHMYDAVRQQPELVAKALEAERLGIERAAEAVADRKRLVLAGIGTSYHAAQIAEHFLRHLTGGRYSARLEQSFELVQYPVALTADDAVLVVSHRGWKNYSVEALRAARAAGALTVAVTGRDPGAGIQTAEFLLTTCEQEVSYAHTKSYMTALAVLGAFAIHLAERRGFLVAEVASARAALARVPQLIREALRCDDAARRIARAIAKRQRWIFVGAGPNWATAQEGALKVKETSYMASEGYETEQFLHGPLAEIDERAATVVLLAGGPSDERGLSVLRALGELGALRVAVTARGVGEAPAEHHIEVPAAPEWISPFVQVIPVQLLSYYVAVERGSNPDTGREDDPAHHRAREHFQL